MLNSSQLHERAFLGQRSHLARVDSGQNGVGLKVVSFAPRASGPSMGSGEEDVLAKDSGECAICLEDLVQGDTIARLPCLCIYHKGFPVLLLRKAICSMPTDSNVNTLVPASEQGARPVDM
ncbi:hypothetical protein JZ751_000542 [Albula glossodonta]|uniref:RING-type E3 ubiquitin transferase n=1 Tax=Albula glossodonta TaxID=121402 RepID=A0A8T2PWN3_9TELE|nr:hypothetical protein JZ751_000542 [Albula glossodonta]